ncbi:MAG TPA: orotidine-5'-phosphate decarboxylase [Longimicrobiales bacterium]|nr:orotidine-5'-phosphate decarboxylase [Longimicrobiales bacterium]
MAEVIVALDVATGAEALRLTDRLGSLADFYKIGLELYTREGPSVVSDLRSRDKRVFLDLKLHDIPNTVAGAVAGASELGVQLLTVHAAGGRAMLEVAREAAGGGLRLLAVTVLTSLEAADLCGVWGREVSSVRDEVSRLTSIARGAGVDGVVAAASDAARIRAEAGGDFLIVVPGIRPRGSDRDDQRRVATPAEAVCAGADYLVVGRAVTRAPDPAAALAAVLTEVEEAAPRGT